MQQLTSEMRLTNGSDGSLVGKVLGEKGDNRVGTGLMHSKKYSQSMDLF